MQLKIRLQLGEVVPEEIEDESNISSLYDQKHRDEFNSSLEEGSKYEECEVGVMGGVNTVLHNVGIDAMSIKRLEAIPTRNELGANFTD